MPKKRFLIILAIVAVVGMGGYAAWQLIQQAQKQQAYEASPDKVADDFIRAFAAQDVKSAMQLFSRDLRASFSEAYWKDVYFSRVKGHTGTAVLRNKGPVQPQSPDEPNRYDPQLKQDATQYSYDFDVRGSPYRVTIVVFRENDTWKINEVEGGYLRNE